MSFGVVLEGVTRVFAGSHKVLETVFCGSLNMSSKSPFQLSTIAVLWDPVGKAPLATEGPCLGTRQLYPCRSCAQLCKLIPCRWGLV